MTEREFDQRVDAAAQRFEERVEGAADALDRAVTHGLERRWFRFFFRTLSFAAEAGLIAGAFSLFQSGHRLWAGVCFWVGAIGLLCDVCRCLFLRRE